MDNYSNDIGPINFVLNDTIQIRNIIFFLKAAGKFYVNLIAK